MNQATGGWFLFIVFIFFVYGMFTGGFGDNDDESTREKEEREREDWQSSPFNKIGPNYRYKNKD